MDLDYRPMKNILEKCVRTGAMSNELAAAVYGMFLLNIENHIVRDLLKEAIGSHFLEKLIAQY